MDRPASYTIHANKCLAGAPSRPSWQARHLCEFDVTGVATAVEVTIQVVKLSQTLSGRCRRVWSYVDHVPASTLCEALFRHCVFRSVLSSCARAYESVPNSARSIGRSVQNLRSSCMAWPVSREHLRKPSVGPGARKSRFFLLWEGT